MGVERKRIIDSFPCRSDMDKNVQIKSKTLSNVTRDFKIPIEGRFFTNDRASAAAALRAMETGPPEHNYVLDSSKNVLTVGKTFIVLASPYQLTMLKRYGRSVISIDSTHNTSKTTGKKGAAKTAPLLTTIVVQDDGKEGIPVAYCISDGKCADTWIRFFEVLKESLGGRLHTDAFLTDDDPSFYNAWEIVMGKPTSRRLCLWHVKRNWAPKVCCCELLLNYWQTSIIICSPADQIAYCGKG